jgi:hypothetical protein
MTIFSLRYRTLIIHLAILIFFAGCANGNQCKIEDRIYSESPIIGFVWNTRGGGDMRFAVEKEGKHYKITVERYNFHTIIRIITLTYKNDEVYRLVDDIFEKRVDLHDYVFVPKGLTGTWTEITLINKDHRETTIDKIDAVGDLNILYQYVHNAVKTL